MSPGFPGLLFDARGKELDSEIKGAVRPFGVAIDYDDTFTTCPETWTKVINVLRDAGAHVFCVSFRSPEQQIIDFPGEIFYTSGTPKAQYMHAQQVDVHVWIDDWPALIGENPDRTMVRRLFQGVMQEREPQLALRWGQMSLG